MQHTKKERNDKHDKPTIGKNATLEVERHLVVEKVICENVKRSCHSDSDGQPKDKKRKKRNVKEITINVEITLDFEVRLYHLNFSIVDCLPALFNLTHTSQN